MIARKCMGDKGDARTALDMAANVVKARLERLDEDSTALTDGPLIKLKDVAVLNRAQNRGILEQIEGLPQACKMCLVALIALGKSQVTESTIGKLRNFVSQCVDEEDDHIAADDFERCLETLKDSGLLRMETANLNNLSIHQKTTVVIRLGLQLEDVQIAVDKVCQGEFYERVARLAELNSRDLSA